MNGELEGLGDPRASYLVEILAQLDARGVEYAVLHKFSDERPDVTTDVDIVTGENPKYAVEPILVDLQKQGRLLVVSRFHYDIPHSYYYIIAVGERRKSFLHIDLLFDQWGLNRYRLTSGYLLRDRVREPWGFRLNHDRRALYLLLKRAYKDDLFAPKAKDLSRALRLNSAELTAGIAEWFGRGSGLLVQKLVATDDLPEATAILRCLREKADRRFVLRYPVRYSAAHILTVARRFARFVRPTGLFVALVGPDGVGKSTSSEQAVDRALGAFRRTARFHWRPGLLPKLGGPNRSGQVGNDLQIPPDASAYRGVVSLARFVYYWLDFVIGYWLIIYPRVAQSTLMVGERYFPDVLVQPERYGFAVQHCLMRAAAWLVPKPHLVVLLEDEPDVIHARKPELSPERTAELLAAYKTEIGHWGNARILSAKGGPDAVAERLAAMIIEERAKRTGRRLARKR